MVIHCLFVIREEKDPPELLVAWDEHQVRDDLGGWEEDCQSSLAELEGAYIRSTYVDVRVAGTQLEELVWGSEVLASLHAPPQ